MRERARFGADGVVAALKQECGVERTVRAVEAHASRLRVSLRRRYECPECGRMTPSLNRQTGLCPVCNMQYNVEVQRVLYECEKAEMAESCNKARIVELSRQYDALRQKRTRMRKAVRRFS